MKARQETDAGYGVQKCPEIVIKRGLMVKAEGLDVLAKRMKALDPKQNENYKFLGFEQVEQINTGAVYKRVKTERDKRMKALPLTELFKKNY